MSVTLASTTTNNNNTTTSRLPSPAPIDHDGEVTTLRPPTSSLPCGLRPQKSISITLTGPSIFTVSATLLLSIHCLGSRLTECLVLVAPLVVLLRNDYENFLNLGPGGTPSTVYGYLQISWWRLWALRDPFTAPVVLSSSQIGGVLQKQGLPYRSGPRPIVAGIAPQRQLDQHGSRHSYLTLRRAMVKLGTRSPLRFGTERSCVEKHGLALFAKYALRTNCQGEIVHVHDSDHSMHMCLHPDDIKVVLSKGWGQRHPLARNGRVLRMPVSPNFVMIYAPRHTTDEQELQIIYRIIEAAIWYTSEERVSLS